MHGGLGSAVLLIVFSPVVSGAETSIVKDVDLSRFPLTDAGIVSICSGSCSG